jgi:hypothetical protein
VVGNQSLSWLYHQGIVGYSPSELSCFEYLWDDFHCLNQTLGKEISDYLMVCGMIGLECYTFKPLNLQLLNPLSFYNITFCFVLVFLAVLGD